MTTSPASTGQGHPTITCEDVRPYLEEYWGKTDTLSADRQLHLQVHLRTCEDCQGAFADIMQRVTPPWKR